MRTVISISIAALMAVLIVSPATAVGMVLTDTMYGPGIHAAHPKYKTEKQLERSAKRHHRKQTQTAAKAAPRKASANDSTSENSVAERVAAPSETAPPQDSRTGMTSDVTPSSSAVSDVPVKGDGEKPAAIEEAKATTPSKP